MTDIAHFPRPFKIKFGQVSHAEQLDWERDRRRAMADPLYLGTEILGMDFQENPHRVLFNQFLNLADAEYTQFFDLSGEYKKFMILWSRGTFKSSAALVAQVQVTLNYPDIRICHMTGGKELAERHLGRFNRIFTNPTDRFEWLFPDFCQTPRSNTRHEFTVSARSRSIFGEPTMAISTAKSVKAGSHFDMIFIDDLVNETNYRSVKALEKCYQDYLDVTPLLEPSGYMIVTGTRYSFGDTYERIQEKAEEEEKKIGRTIWKFSIRGCWKRQCGSCEHYEDDHFAPDQTILPPCTKCACKRFSKGSGHGVLFPQTRTRDGRIIGHSEAWLKSEEVRAGPEFWANQYLNAPMAAGTQTFTPDLLARQTLFRLDQIPSGTIAPTFFVGDLSYVGDEKRDKTVLYAVRLHQGKLYVFDCLFGQWDSEAVAQNMITWIYLHRPYIIYLERFLGWEAYDKVFRGVAKQRGLQRLPLEWHKMSTVEEAKKKRIGAIKSPLAQGRLWLFAGMDGYETLLKELQKWPKLGRRDDFADCLGLVCEVPSGYETQATSPPPPSLLRKYHPLDDPIDGAYDDSGAGSGIQCE